MYSRELIVSNAPIFVLQGVSMHVHHPIFSHVYRYWENVSTMLLLCKYQYIMDSKRKLNYTYITLLSHKWTSKGGNNNFTLYLSSENKQPPALLLIPFCNFVSRQFQSAPKNLIKYLVDDFSPGHVRWIVFYPFFRIVFYPIFRIVFYPFFWIVFYLIFFG